VHRYASDERLEVGAVVQLQGRYWLIESLEPDGEGIAGKAVAKPGRYRLTLRHPEGPEETGAFRRLRPDAPGVGHTFSTLEDGRPVGWEVRDRRLARDEQGEIYLELIAERNFEEIEELPDHELEHALARRQEDLAERASATLDRAAQAGLSIELVSLEPGEEADWEEAERFIDALVIEEINDDLVVLCGVDPERDSPESWITIVKERLRSDLESFRRDVQDDRDEIEEWSFQGGSIFVSVGAEDDEADPNKGHGWMTRLVDAGVLGAAKLRRVRKADIQ
jgi:hypothetical protein